MRKRKQIKFVVLLFAVCMLLSSCGGNPDKPTYKEKQESYDAEREAAQAICDKITEQLMSENVPEAPEAPRIVKISADSPERLLYRDSTMIVYTVHTPKDCTEVIMSIPYHSYSTLMNMKSFSREDRQHFDEYEKAVLWGFNMPLAKQTFTPLSEGVTIEEKEDALVWTIPCDFGFTGAQRVAAEAVCPGDDAIRPFGIARVNIRYPEYNIIDEFEVALRAAIEHNQDETFYFVCDFSKTSLDYNTFDLRQYTLAPLMGLSRTIWNYDDATVDAERITGMKYGNFWDYATLDPEVYGSSLFTKVPYYAQLMTTLYTDTEEGSEHINFKGMYVPEGKGIMLCGMKLGNDNEFRIDPGIRAVICQQGGIKVNSEDFPFAAVVQAVSQEAIAQCIKPDMSEFEKAKALFDWMYARSKSASPKLPKNFNKLPEAEQLLYYKTAYGFMKEGFGDCMGWSGTFYVLCRMAGLKCYFIYCAATPGGATAEEYTANHRLNALLLDGELYYADTYWGAAGSGFATPQYKYFLITSQEAAKYYTWNAKLNIPEATATKYALDPVTGELLK